MSWLRPIWDPAARRPGPAPAQVNLLRLFRLGTALWAVAMVVTLVAAALSRAPWRTAALCAAGTAIGLALLAWEARRRRRQKSQR